MFFGYKYLSLSAYNFQIVIILNTEPSTPYAAIYNFGKIQADVENWKEHRTNILESLPVQRLRKIQNAEKFWIVLNSGIRCCCFFFEMCECRE